MTEQQNIPSTEPESPPKTSEPVPRWICDRCGAEMKARQCKLICPNCGNRFDCSDLSLYFD